MLNTKYMSLEVIDLPLMIGSVLIEIFQNFYQPLILGLDFMEGNTCVFNAEQKTLFMEDHQS